MVWQNNVNVNIYISLHDLNLVHSMLISSISFPDLINFLTLWGYPWKKGLGWKEAQRQGDCTNNFNIYTYTSQNINIGPSKCMWQIFTLASCKCNKKYIPLQQDKCKCDKIWMCKCKWFTLALDLHAIYRAINTYTHNTGLNQCW